jgi:uncharacterized protein YndB with AHSA1/START domain
MLRIDQTYFIKASPERVWAALTDAALMAKWSGTAARYEARVGGTYALWDDYVRGEVVVFEPQKKLAQTWQPNNWAIQNSVVTFTLKKTRGGTRLDLAHENVQPEDYDGTANGWEEFYIGAIQAMLEAENPKPQPKQIKRAARQKKAAAKAKRAPAKKRVVGAPKKKKAPMKRKKTSARK